MQLYYRNIKALLREMPFEDKSDKEAAIVI